MVEKAYSHVLKCRHLKRAHHLLGLLGLGLEKHRRSDEIALHRKTIHGALLCGDAVRTKTTTHE